MSYHWKDVVATEASSVRDSLKLMDCGLRIVLVVDEHWNLLGVVTDGDVRRALLGGVSIEDSVIRVMNTSPVTMEEGTSREALVALMREKEILCVPLVSGSQLVGLELLHNSNSVQPVKNPVFLMAGGFGRRLHPMTEDCPKPLLKVGGKPILERVLESFIAAGFSDFYISVHYLSHMIIEHFGDGSKWSVRIQYVEEETPLGTGGALSLLPDDLSPLPLIVMNCDVLTNVDFRGLLDFHNKYKASATMCVREYHYQVPYGVIAGDGRRVVNMIEKPTKSEFVNAGIYVLDRSVRNYLKRNERIDMPTLLTVCMENGNEVNMFPIFEYWLDIGRYEDFERAQVDVKLLERFQ